MRAGRALLFLFVAIVAGLVAAELIYRLPLSRHLLARACGLETEMSPLTENLRANSRAQPVEAAAIEREMNLLRDQFGDDRLFADELAASGVSLGEMREAVSKHMQECAWIEAQIAPQLGVTEDEVRGLYEKERAQFAEPQRFRASHLFLAAPDGSAPEIVLAKQNAILSLSVRVLAGEDFVALVTEASEDERTKLAGGDLGYFSAARMPPEFMAEVEKLSFGQISAPIRSHLGFHLLQLTDLKPAQTLTLDEARPEINLSLGNTKRRQAVAQLRARLAQAR